MCLKRNIRNKIFTVINSIGRLVLNISIFDKSFSIFSNDCFAGEIYKWMRLPYNTPFIGLMLMGPCYIKFLQNPKYYFDSELKFIDESSYREMNDFRKANHIYPLGKLEDIEIHFLHYSSRNDAKLKWERRIKRINWSNLKIKFSVDKDYSTKSTLNEFEKLEYNSKVSFSNINYKSKSNIMIPGNVLDATVTFYLSLKVFNLIGWLNDGTIHFNSTISKLRAYLLFLTLRS